MRAKQFLPATFIFPMLLLVLLLQVLPAQAQTYGMKLSNRRSVKSDWFGIGSQNTTRDGMYIDHPSLLDKAPTMNPKVIRFPSGGNANWWDWKTGWFVDDPNVPPHNPNQAPVYNTLENFKVLVDATGATPLFVLNMISSTLAYQLEMLHYADSIGLEVKYLELGNEFYLAEEEDSTYIYSIYPDAKVYGTVASLWIDSIHAHFPNAEVAAQGAFNRNNQPRRIQWDDDLLQTLEGEDAITFHQYYNGSGTEASGDGDGKYTMADVPEFLYRPFKAWGILAAEDLPLVRSGREVWITEFNLQDFNYPVHGSWGQSLFVATQTLHFLESEKITNVNFHTICGTSGYGGYFTDTKGFKFKSEGSFQEPPNPPTTTPWNLTAAGNSVKIISEAVNGMKYASQLTFEGAPSIGLLDKEDSVYYPALYGWQFSNNTSSSAILVNLSGTDLKINTTDVFKNGGSYKRISASPVSYIAKSNDVTTKTGTLTATFTLPAYSITKVTSSNYAPSAPPTVSIAINGNTTFCEGDSLSLSAGDGHLTYLWSTGQTAKQIWAKSSGDYWVRVWDEASGYWAADTVSVTVHPAPEVPTIKNTGKDAFCAGSNTVLKPKKIEDNATYLWSTGATGTSLTVATPGNYTLTIIDQEGCTAVSAPLAISVYPLPQTTIVPSGPLSFCNGGSVVLTAGAGFKTYKWSTGKFGQSLTASATGSYSVTVTDYNNCENTTTAINVNVLPTPSANVSIFGPTAFCDGKSPTYLVAPSGYPSYQWMKGANNIAGATTKKYYPVDNGTYKVSVKDNNNCTIVSDGTVITVLKKPKAQVTVGGPTNICDGESCELTANVGSGFSYQWMVNNANIPGATQIAYTVTQPGVYKCKITDANGCNANTKEITVTSNCKESGSAISSAGDVTLHIFPNPANSYIHIDAAFSGGAREANISISNLLGEEIYASQQQLDGMHLSADIELAGRFTNGIYLVTLSSGEQVVMSKFVITGKR